MLTRVVKVVGVLKVGMMVASLSPLYIKDYLPPQPHLLPEGSLDVDLIGLQLGAGFVGNREAVRQIRNQM